MALARMVEMQEGQVHCRLVQNFFASPQKGVEDMLQSAWTIGPQLILETFQERLENRMEIVRSSR